jgi:Zn-finger nucleic acid-binding protein
MQAFFPSSAPNVELDRCPQCAGLWFDWGELEQVLGRKLAPEPLEGATSRRCAFCRTTLSPAVLPGGVPVESCGACRGLYLDAGELAELGGEEPAARKTLEPFNTFACVKCGARFPLSEGNLLRSGLACRGCTPMPQRLKDERAPSVLDYFTNLQDDDFD